MPRSSGFRFLAFFAIASTALAGEPAERVRVAVHTSEGTFEAEVYPRLAPETVRLFLARAAGDAPAEAAPYAGTQVCEVRGSVHVVFGCQPFENTGPKPVAARLGPQAPDEIDGRAMGLGEQILSDDKTVHALWQLEVFPRWGELHDAGRPVPAGLASLVEAFKAKGSAAEAGLRGRSKLWYLEAIGFSYRDGLSPLRVTRGSLATFTMWPGEADERFLVALDDLTERDGRATVFGRVVSGWETIERIASLPPDNARRPLRPVLISSVAVDRAADSAASSNPSRSTR